MKQLWRKFVGQWAFSDSDFVIFAPNKQTEKHGKHCLKILIEIKILIKPCQQVTLAVCILQLAYMCPVQLSFNPMGCPWDFPGKNAVGGWKSPSSGDFPDPGIEPAAPAASPALRTGSLPLSHQGSPNVEGCKILKRLGMRVDKTCGF